MDPGAAIPKGVWYEVQRNRWRVKLFCDGKVYHRSYHKDYLEAVAVCQQARKKMIKPRPIVPIQEASLINQFLCQPLVGAGRVTGH